MSKLAIILFSVCTGAFTLLARDSSGQDLKKIRISLNERDKSLDLVLADIERLSNLHFVYESEQVVHHKIDHYSVSQGRLATVLGDLLTPCGLGFRQKGDNIVVERLPKAMQHSPSTNTGGPVTVTGKVTDEKGEPRQGVTVTVKGTGKSVVSKENGAYSIQAQTQQVLIFSFVGYGKVERLIGNNTVIDITIQPENSQMANVVVVGYGTQNRRDVTTAISSLKADDINNFPAPGVDKAMTGRMAGVQVLEPNGSPGAGITIAIRGKSSVTAGTSPLYVIDGIPLSEAQASGPGVSALPLTENPLNAINLSDIESIDVLKDASAAAIYGSRGSNGVVLITTKRGKKEKPAVGYDSYYGYAQVAKELKMLDAYGYAKLIYDAHNNTYLDGLADRGIAGSITDDSATRIAKLGNNSVYVIPSVILPYVNGQKGLTNTNWQDAIFRHAPVQNHTLSVSGGSNNIRFYISGNYLDQNGVVIKSGFKRYSGRINLDANFNKLRIGTTTNFAYEDYQFQPSQGRYLTQEYIVPIALSYAPFFPIYNADGSYNYSQYNFQGATQIINPVALANLKKDNTGQSKLLSNTYVQYNFTPELSDKVSFGITIDNANRNAFRPSTLPTTSPSSPTSVPIGNFYNSTLANWLVENTVSYVKSFGDHHINAIADFSAQKETTTAFGVTSTGYANDLVTTLNGATSVTAWAGDKQQWSLLSGLARVQYSYQGKYLASAAIRTDGSSRFGINSKYGYFPSASVGWNVDRESFMMNQQTMSSLKLRASYGLTGNNQIGNYAALSTLAQGNYVFGSPDALANGLYQNTAGNSKLGWEQTSAFNVGADIGLLKEMLHLTIDAYTNNTSNMLLNVPVPQSSGYSTNLENLGKVRNQGLEFTLTSDNRFGKFRMSNSANISFNRNKVLDLGGQQSIIGQDQGVIYFITAVGKPIGNYYTLVQTGIFKNASDLAKGPTVPGAKVGDMKFKDINGDGVIDATNDRAITGNYMPKFTYGYSLQLQYKWIDLGAGLQGVYGNKIANIDTRYINSEESFTNNLAEALGRFQSESDPGDGTHARANRSERGLNATISSYSIRSGSYMRIRDITLGLSLPDKLLKKSGFARARLYFTATNPFTFMKYNMYNPEASQETNPLYPGVDYGSYPLSKTYVLGLNLSL